MSQKLKQLLIKKKLLLNNLERSIDKASSEMKTFNKEQMIAQSHFGKLASQADVMSKKFSSIGDKMTSLGTYNDDGRIYTNYFRVRCSIKNKCRL